MLKGLSSDTAIRKLRVAIDDEAKKFTRSKLSLLYFTFLHHFSTTCCWILTFVSFAALLCFIYSPFFATQSAFRDDDHAVGGGIVVFLILVAVCALNMYFVYLRTSEIRRKVDTVVRELNQLTCDGSVRLTTPNVYEPASESITLQWTYRDGVLVNLPWMALVEGDVIMLRPGREIPCRCHPLRADTSLGLQFECGQIYIPHEIHLRTDGFGVDAFSPLPCLVDETPAVTYVRACLSASERPRSLTENEYSRMLHFYVERAALPVVLAISLGASAFTYVYDLPFNRHWYETLVTTPAAVLLPLTVPILSVFTWFFGLLNTAQFLVVFSDALTSASEELEKEREREDVELFTEANTSDSSVHVTVKSANRWLSFSRPCQAWPKFMPVARELWKLLKGDPNSLAFSANIVQTLGNVTSLSVVDKKGIMSWANPTPEKVFFFSRSRNKRASYQPGYLDRKKHCVASADSLQVISEMTENDGKSADIADGASPMTKRRHLTVEQQAVRSPGATPRLSVGAKSKSNYQHHFRKDCHAARTHAEVLDLSHDPHRLFVVHFDDPHWRTFSSNLKPLGLNILLNNCSLQQEYIRFIDHVHAISAVVPRTVAVVNRRCLCYLAKAIGFDPSACCVQFDRQQTLASYRKTPGDLPLPGLTKHKTPLPNLFAVIVRDKITGHRQLMCQGTADLVADACEFFWDGADVKPLEKQHRKRISDFSQRHSMTAYCVAFSYRPLSCEMDPTLTDVYMDWPCGSRRVAVGSSVDSMGAGENRPWWRAISYESVLSDEYFEIQKIDAPSEVLQHLLKGQVFLGMISLQYQAKPDVVRLVDNLDKACIRFVHYSKENELRSRVFAEKCGLEAGWNCHISLGKESEAVSSAESHLGSQVLTKISSVARLAPRVIGDAAPTRRPSLPADFKMDSPIVHFKSTTATPIVDSVPKVICESTEEPEDGEEKGEKKEGDEEEEEEDREGQAPLERGDRCASVATISGDSVFDDPADQLIRALTSERERTPLLSDATSRTSVATNHSLTHQPIVLPPNRARLPKGIENVRPHLENVDNVPLLVPLFTDCYPCAIVDMIEIMQDYGEVVCVMGSSLNYRNAGIFSQANASIGIEPLQPALCANSINQRILDGGRSSSTRLAQLITTLPCSISLSAGERINLLDLIATSRHLLTVLRTALLFYLSSSMSTTAVQLLAQLLLLPRPFSVDLLLWLVCLVIPLLSASLCSTPPTADVLKTATPKNSNWVSRNAVRKFLIGFGLRFLPSAAFALFLFACSLVSTCVNEMYFRSARCDAYFNQTNGAMENGTRSGKRPLDPNAVSAAGLAISRHFFTFLYVLYLCTISSGFVHYRALYKDRFPWTNFCWTLVIPFLLLAQAFYTILCVGRVLYDLNTVGGFSATTNEFLPWKVYLCGLVWPLVSVPVNELLKRYELERFRRDQRRRKLSFGTKLGMNSPF